MTVVTPIGHQSRRNPTTATLPSGGLTLITIPYGD
jgi:hypothetical protein